MEADDVACDGFVGFAQGDDDAVAYVEGGDGIWEGVGEGSEVLFDGDVGAALGGVER